MALSLRPKSVRVRLALWFVGALAFVLVVYSAGLYFFLRQSLYEDVDRKLRIDFESVNDTLSGLSLQETLRSLENEHKQQDRWLVEILDGSGTLLGSVPKEDTSTLGKLDSECLNQGRRSSDLISSDALSLRIECGPARIKDKKYVIRVARPIERVRTELWEFLSLMLMGLPFALVLAAVGGYFLTRKLLRPISKMTDEASRISAERLGDRLSVENPEDELGRLGITFNHAFSRIEKTFNEMKRFTADASHELRTPLTVIRTVGEVALRESRDATSYKETISNILEEADNLRHLVESLLTLSRADAGQVTLKTSSVDLTELAKEVVGHLSVLAEEKNQILLVKSNRSVVASIDRSILRQALINIVHNAVKYCPQGAKIEIQILEKNGRAEVVVVDNGPGISFEHHSKLFDRFYRVDLGRSRKEGGSGLGLSIAKWAVEANGGRVELESQPGAGSTFRIFLGKALLVFVSVLAMQSDSRAQIVENFDKTKKGTLPVGWTSGITGEGSPHWFVDDDKTAPSKPNILSQDGSATFSWCVKDDAAVTDGSAEVKIKLISGKEDQTGGIVWRFKDAENYYIARINSLEDNVIFFSMVKGTRRPVKSIDLKVSAKIWHVLKVDFHGAQVSVFFDGRKVLEDDNTEISGPGKVGVWTKTDSATHFDDFSWTKTK